MGVLEVTLFVAGGIIAVLSFLLPMKEEEVSGATRELAKEEIKNLVEQEMESIRSHVDDVVDESIEYAVEKTERSLERLTNEKIMAVNEYSDTVLKEIHKNHEEAMFLYDMLNDKHKNLKNTVSEANKTVQEVVEKKKEAEAVVNTFQQISPQVVKPQEKVISKPQEKAAGEPQEKAISEPKFPQVEPKQTAAPKAAMDLNFMPGGQGKGKDNNERILSLYQEGKSKVAIAKELGLGVGEVKLVIDLYRNLLVDKK